jgi:CubicO group peptidase (beta-lactamase class C family)
VESLNVASRFGAAAVTALLSVFPGAASSAADAAGPWLRLHEYIAAEMPRWSLPGLGIAVVKDDRVVFARAYGVRQAGRSEPFSLTTVMPIGSTTKAMTAALAGMLVSEGRLRWDDRVVEHLPWFQLRDPWVTREVTVRDLLSHRVGIGGALLPAVTSLDGREVLRRFRFLEPWAPFRAQYDYSNVMYAAAGEVIAAIEKKPWEDVLTDRLLKPLRMDTARPRIDALWDAADVAPCFCCDLAARPVGLERARPGVDLAMPHLVRGGKVDVIPWRRYGNVGPAGGELAASVQDLVPWVRFQLGQGRFEGRPLLSGAEFEEMHTPQNPIPAASWPGYLRQARGVNFMAYGLGWRLNDYGGHRLSVHTGNVYGFMATVGLLPAERLGVVVLANADRSGLAPALVMRAFDMALGAPDRDWSAEVRARYDAEENEDAARERALERSRMAGTRPTLPLARYTGAFEEPAYGTIAIALEGDALVLRVPGAQVADLAHWHHDVFRMRLRGPMAYPRFATFVLDAAGAPSELRIEGMGTFQSARRP